MPDSILMNHFRNLFTALAICSLILPGCSERKSAMPDTGNAPGSVAGDNNSAGSAEAKTADQESSPAIVQPAP